MPVGIGRNVSRYAQGASPDEALADDLNDLFVRRVEGQLIAAGGILYAPVANQLGPLAAGAAATVLGITSGLPAWVTPSTYLAHALLSATHSDTTAAAVLRGALVTGQGASPTWSRLALGTAGQMLRSDGTDALWSTATFPNTAVQGDLLYASAANVWGSLAIGGAGGLLVVNAAANAPAWVALGGAGALLVVNAGATQPAWLAAAGAGAILQMNAAGTQPAWTAAITSGQVVYATTNGVLVGAAGFTFDGTALTLAAAPTFNYALTPADANVPVFINTPVTIPAAQKGWRRISGVGGAEEYVPVWGA